MENTAKAHPSATMPLLPISNNPSNPILSHSITSRCVAKLVLVHHALLLALENPNLVSWVRFKSIEASISYEDNPLSKFPVGPFELGLKEHKRLRVKFSTTVSHEGRPGVKERIFEEIKRQHEDDAMNFNMHLFAWATYSNGWWGTQDIRMEAQCLNLRVGFLPKVGFGSWISGGPMICSTGSYAS
ncbi:hypothetical protein ACFX13_014264 [Malus domestica]